MTSPTCEICSKELSHPRFSRCRVCSKGTLEERFEAKVERFDDGCWFWLGSISKAGYGQLRTNWRLELAHRVSYEMFVSPIPEGYQSDHLCRNRACVNPAHLEPVLPRENALRGASGDLKESCADGHPWVPENWASNGTNGRKTCLICKREREKEGRERRKAKRLEAEAERKITAEAGLGSVA